MQGGTTEVTKTTLRLFSMFPSNEGGISGLDLKHIIFKLDYKYSTFKIALLYIVPWVSRMLYKPTEASSHS